MTMDRVIHHFIYLSVGIVSLLLAVFISSKVVRSSYSQSQVSQMSPAGTAPATNAPPAATGSKIPAAPTTKATTPAGAVPIVVATGANTDAITDSGSFLEPYVFDMREGRRNPFRMPVPNEGSPSDVLLPGTPLERFELDELKLVGILWDVKAPKAMIIDPQGEVHIIGKDDRIGRKRGYIAVIREGEVVVVETTSFNGENTYSTRVLRIAN